MVYVINIFNYFVDMRRRTLQKEEEIILVEGSYITCVYNVNDTSSATQILDNVDLFDLTQVTSIVVDGKKEAVARTHTFNTTGKHTVIFILDMSVFHSMYCMFRGCKRLVNIDLSHFDLTNNVSFNCTFHSCINLESVDISNQNVSKCTTLAYMFWNDDDTIVHKLHTINFQNCDFSNVTSMYGTFRGCHSLYQLNFIDLKTSTKLTTCFALFNCCYKLPSLWLGSINTTNVTNVSYMFGSCLALTSITFKTPINNVTTYSNVFYNIKTSGMLYFPSAYSFYKLTNQLPSTWRYGYA